MKTDLLKISINLRCLQILKDGSWQPGPKYVRKKLDFTTLDHIGFGGAKNMEMVKKNFIKFYQIPWNRSK